MKRKTITWSGVYVLYCRTCHVRTVYRKLKAGLWKCPHDHVDDAGNVLWALFGFWYDDGWGVEAHSVSRPSGWRGGREFVSRDPFGAQAPDALPLEIEINGVKYRKV
jgi:hypothetical protein